MRGTRYRSMARRLFHRLSRRGGISRPPYAPYFWMGSFSGDPPPPARPPGSRRMRRSADRWRSGRRAIRLPPVLRESGAGDLIVHFVSGEFTASGDLAGSWACFRWSIGLINHLAIASDLSIAGRAGVAISYDCRAHMGDSEYCKTRVAKDGLLRIPHPAKQGHAGGGGPGFRIAILYNQERMGLEKSANGKREEGKKNPNDRDNVARELKREREVGGNEFRRLWNYKPINATGAGSGETETAPDYIKKKTTTSNGSM